MTTNYSILETITTIPQSILRAVPRRYRLRGVDGTTSPEYGVDDKVRWYRRATDCTLQLLNKASAQC